MLLKNRKIESLIDDGISATQPVENKKATTLWSALHGENRWRVYSFYQLLGLQYRVEKPHSFVAYIKTT
jgi:hypothetical protein